jgi:hypothetical protein
VRSRTQRVRAQARDRGPPRQPRTIELGSTGGLREAIEGIELEQRRCPRRPTHTSPDQLMSSCKGSPTPVDAGAGRRSRSRPCAVQSSSFGVLAPRMVPGRHRGATTTSTGALRRLHFFRSLGISNPHDGPPPRLRRSAGWVGSAKENLIVDPGWRMSARMPYLLRRVSFRGVDVKDRGCGESFARDSHHRTSHARLGGGHAGVRAVWHKRGQLRESTGLW